MAEPNAFAIDVAVAAFTKGEVWLDELRAYISENKRVAATYIKENIKELTVIPSDATYLLWVNCEKVSEDAEKLVKKIREKTGLYLSDGNVFGGDPYELSLSERADEGRIKTAVSGNHTDKMIKCRNKW